MTRCVEIRAATPSDAAAMASVLTKAFTIGTPLITMVKLLGNYH